MNNTYKKGLWGEVLAAIYLFFLGYRFLTHRYRVKTGEIDLIMRRKSTIVFVEVKRRERLEDGLEAVLPRSQMRIQKTAQFFLSQNPKYQGDKCRIDVVVTNGWRILKHIRNAF